MATNEMEELFIKNYLKEKEKDLCLTTKNSITLELRKWI